MKINFIPTNKRELAEGIFENLFAEYNAVREQYLAEGYLNKEDGDDICIKMRNCRRNFVFFAEMFLERATIDAMKSARPRILDKMIDDLRNNLKIVKK